MSPRARKASDEAVFAATQRVMLRLGPGELSLAEIAAEAGVTSAALVQRYGSRRELLLAVLARYADETRAMLDGIRSGRRSPLAALDHYAACMAAMGESPAALAHHLSYLQLDLTDPGFQRHMRRSAQITRDVLTEWLDEAVAEGALRRDVNTRGLARLVELTISGSLLTWAVYQEGSAAAWMRRDLRALLEPYRATTPRQQQARRVKAG